MESNKDEAVKCVSIAKEAIAAGNKQRALKFIGIARRLNHNLSVDDLLSACEDLDSASSRNEKPISRSKSEPASSIVDEISNVGRSYTEEHVQLIRQVNRSMGYYEILGVEKNCSADEIKKAYRKLSLKVHPDKNKAPGSEEAFKKVGKAFKCLSVEDSRRQYDQTGLVDEFENNQQTNNVRRRRRRTGNDFFDDDFDPDEIFRTFFGQSDVFGSARGVYRTRRRTTRTNQHQRGDNEGGGVGPMLIILQIIPFMLIILLAYLPFTEPDYSLQKNQSFQLPMMTEKHDVEFFVKSQEFDQKFPPGSSARAEIETNVIKDYKNMLSRYCHIELQRRQWSRNFPTPYCNKLQSFGVAAAS
ncbi:chaperone protein dnaJ 49-like [Impatiens glandulifera]|uniref:chaperone protein dnaJ 49-like n=1 Tax=Impatiens glandulifera TaxID=253017 RepID=UPI001FB0B5B1|nr:chaperone protein dnaJ 49-like [Impatiens glandulifera]XP_047317831.1 chaperone protein dnaJ 49-like [Impatiens glandulifera]